MVRWRLLVLLAALTALPAPATKKGQGGGQCDATHSACCSGGAGAVRSASLLQAGQTRRAVASLQDAVAAPDAERPLAPEKWRSSMQAKPAESAHGLQSEAEALSVGLLAVSTQGAAEVSLIIIVVVIGVAVCLLWHNNWSVQGSVDESREIAGKVGVVAKKATHGAAVKVEKLTRPKDAAVAGSSSSTDASPANPASAKQQEATLPLLSAEERPFKTQPHEAEQCC
mmetsp:Transcript_5110/g.14913  ORF Transcript_5110/g.14913 Transcript_5110/m.14913 type:complete len:227 (+) Transcript_5110:82-762(+)